jgi:hypothetical protein
MIDPESGFAIFGKFNKSQVNFGIPFKAELVFENTYRLFLTLKHLFGKVQE